MGLLECERLPAWKLDWEEDRGKLGLSGGQFAPNCFRSATQFPLEPLTLQLFLESRARGRGSQPPQHRVPRKSLSLCEAPLVRHSCCLSCGSVMPTHTRGAPDYSCPHPGLWPAASRPLGTDFQLLEYPKLFQTLNHLCLWAPQKHLPSSPLF